MSAHAHAAEPDAPVVYTQYETIEQQQETYILGMWAFLVTEIMFFGALFLIYTLYRWQYQRDFFIFHEQLDWRLGGVNTLVLLTSSFTMALAVHYHQKRKKGPTLACLGLTNLGALGFLGIKAVEYGEKIKHHLVPNDTFFWDAAAHGGNPEHARVFFSLYFSMTGLHGVHVLIGFLVISLLMVLIAIEHPLITDYIPTEMVGLYWHFVDLVWIFLYPLYYLIPK